MPVYSPSAADPNLIDASAYRATHLPDQSSPSLPADFHADYAAWEADTFRRDLDDDLRNACACASDRLRPIFPGCRIVVMPCNTLESNPDGSREWRYKVVISVFREEPLPMLIGYGPTPDEAASSTIAAYYREQDKAARGGRVA